MFKFTDQGGSQIWVNHKDICAIEHMNDPDIPVHLVYIYMNSNDTVFIYEPTSEEDCRKFLFDLFKAMGEEYKYE